MAASPDSAVFNADVAIVGFGPSGAVAAGLLALQGLRVHVIERETGVYDKPRAIALDHEILRIFQQLGVLDAVLQHAEPFTPSEYFGVDGQLIKRMTMLPPPYPLGHTPSMVFTQPLLEHALRECVAALPGVQVTLGSGLVGLQQDSHGVTLQCQRSNGNGNGNSNSSVHSLRVRHVIGCDGASSSVRGLLGIPLDDLGFDEPWLVVDVLVNDRGLARLPRTSVQYCEPERPCTMVIGPGRHRRWEIALQPGEDPLQAATPAGTWALLARWLAPDEGELWRQASYRFHALVAQRWHAGRVFLAGDAAHQQPPFLGQGMCQGIRDVANLAWKLSLVQHGGLSDVAAATLIQSYALERGAHVRELTRRIKAIGAVICERDPARARARDAQLLADCGGVVPDTPRQDLMPRLESGCLSATVSTARGTLFPQPRVATPGSPALLLDDLMPPGWRLAVDAQLAPAVPGLLALAIERGAPAVGLVPIGVDSAEGLSTWHETEGVVAAWWQQHACHAALVRPDHSVFGVAATAAELQALIDEFTTVLASAATHVHSPLPMAQH